ncbi:MAG: hypothetical protein DHS20C01_32520 [marine bacterium B5-7]|nr:MAG: hypothetical protein DHS20C01_32520 [marine bacterium B5-7]
MRIWTVGHSNRDLDYFIQMLRQHHIECLVDVRRQPVSRRFPWFEGDVLRNHIENAGLRYHFAGVNLGGRRNSVVNSPNIAVKGFWRGYADHMQTDAFLQSIGRLKNLAEAMTVAVMCAEGDPDHCHRSMIADYLYFERVETIHIIDTETCRTHTPNPLARPLTTGIVYDRNQTLSIC